MCLWPYHKGDWGDSSEKKSQDWTVGKSFEKTQDCCSRGVVGFKSAKRGGKNRWSVFRGRDDLQCNLEKLFKGKVVGGNSEGHKRSAERGNSSSEVRIDEERCSEFSTVRRKCTGVQSHWRFNRDDNEGIAEQGKCRYESHHFWDIQNKESCWGKSLIICLLLIHPFVLLF